VDVLDQADGTPVHIPAAEVKSAFLFAGSTAGPPQAGVPGFNGNRAVASGTNLGFSGPAWAVPGNVAWFEEHEGSRIDYPARPLEDLAPFARYPHGSPSSP
jgi:hypothetical protein